MNTLERLKWFCTYQLGINPIRFTRSLLNLPSYIVDWIHFRRNYSGKMTIMPCLHDRRQESGDTKNEYFWQDLIVSRAIHSENPNKHLDIGSRIDGLIAHIASFRECEVLDIRTINSHIPGVTFKQVDIMETPPTSTSLTDHYCDSISCLHTIEHFGLGRYGDPIHPKGYELGICNIGRLLKPDGTLYLSTPVGKERIEFNANRVFSQ
jgi:hypothetical protein